MSAATAAAVERYLPEALRVEVVPATEGAVGAQPDPHVPPDLRPVPAADMHPSLMNHFTANGVSTTDD